MSVRKYRRNKTQIEVKVTTDSEDEETEKVQKYESKKQTSPKGTEAVLDFYAILKESKEDRENFAVQALDVQVKQEKN